MQEGKFRIFELKDIPYSSMVMVNSRSWIFSHSFLFVLEPLKGELLRLTYWVCLVAPSSWKPCSHKEKEKKILLLLPFLKRFCLCHFHLSMKAWCFIRNRKKQEDSVCVCGATSWTPCNIPCCTSNLSVHDAEGFRWSPSSKWENY